MESEIYSDYVCYEIDAYYHEHPYGPNRCPMCGKDLSQLEIEPSRAMRDDFEQEKSRIGGWGLGGHATFLYTCNGCHWWGIRDACEFVDLGSLRKEYSDYLIFAVAGNNEPKEFKDTLESAQPWLKPLDDPDLFDRNVVRYLPKELAKLIYKPSGSTENALTSQRTIDDLSKYDPFIIRARDFAAKTMEKKLRKAEPRIRLSSGDKVRITSQTVGKGGGQTVVTNGNIGTVISYDEFRKVKGEYTFRHLEEWIDDGIHYPIRIETNIPPSEEDCAFWNSFLGYFGIHGVSQYGNIDAWNASKVLLIEVDCLEKITDAQNSENPERYEERLFLQAGDLVRIKRDEVDLHCDFPGTYVIATQGSTGVVVSYDEYRVYYERLLGQHHMNEGYLSDIKKAIKNWRKYPIKFGKVAPASDPDAIVCCKEGKFEPIAIDILEKIIYFNSNTILIIDQVSVIVMPDGSDPQAEEGYKLLAIRFSIEHQGTTALHLSSSTTWLVCSDHKDSYLKTSKIQPSQLELPKGKLSNGVRSYGWAIFKVPDYSYTHEFGFEIPQVGKIKTTLKSIPPRPLHFLPLTST